MQTDAKDWDNWRTNGLSNFTIATFQIFRLLWFSKNVHQSFEQSHCAHYTLPTASFLIVNVSSAIFKNMILLTHIISTAEGYPKKACI